MRRNADIEGPTGEQAAAGDFRIDLVPDPVAILRKDGAVYDINDACIKLFGNEKANLLGRKYDDIAPLKALREKIDASIGNYEEYVDRIDYGKRHFEVSLLPFRGRRGTVRLRIIFKDISNFVTLEKELRRRNRELVILNSLSGTFISSENMDSAVEDLFSKALMITDFNTGWLMLKEERLFKLKTAMGISPGFRKSLEDHSMQFLCDEAAGSKDPLFILEAADISNIRTLRDEKITFLAIISLAYESGQMGLLFVADRDEEKRDFDFDHAALLSLIGKHITLIMDKIRLFQETKRLAMTDALTGLYNSRYFYRQLDIEIARTNRYGNSFSIILFDIDNFKKLNDTLGHQAGDKVLHELADIFRSISRETDVVVRYGGEEFIIILPNTSEEDTLNLAGRILITVEKTVFLSSHARGVNITLSGGAASYPQNADGARSLLNAADTAMYAAKRAGKNRIECFRGKMNEKDIQ